MRRLFSSLTVLVALTAATAGSASVDTERPPPVSSTPGTKSIILTAFHGPVCRRTATNCWPPYRGVKAVVYNSKGKVVARKVTGVNGRAFFTFTTNGIYKIKLITPTGVSKMYHFAIPIRYRTEPYQWRVYWCNRASSQC